MNMPRGFSAPPRDLIISLSDDVCDTSFKQVINAYNELNEGESLFIYLNSPGGDVLCAEALIDIINQNCDRTVITAYGEVCSAAFDIFFRSECERRILPGTSGMAHVARITTTTVKDNQALGETGEHIRKWGKEEFNRRINYYKELGFSKLELKSLQGNKDVWFMEPRLRTLLKNHIKLINARY